MTMTLEELKNINIDMYRLPENTMEIINNLNGIFKGLNDNKQYHKPYTKQERMEYNKTKQEHPKKEQMDPKYLASTKRQADIGIQRDIKEITLLMNKMTDKNYEKISNNLFESFEYVFKEYHGNDELEKITDNMNNTIKYNSAYSTVYSKFYKVLVDKYGKLFADGIVKINTLFVQSMEDLWYVDSDEDYDKYCKMIQDNKIRKSLLIFITKLVMNDYYNEDTYANYMSLLTSKIEHNMNSENSTPIVEELGEMLYDMLTSSDLEKVKEFECWETITQFVQKMKGVSPKVVKSFSMRCKFKYMDMNDYLNGKKK
jgi:hypothetical protein